MADNCYVVGPLPSDNPPRTPFRRAALSRAVTATSGGPTAPTEFFLPFYSVLSPSSSVPSYLPLAPRFFSSRPRRVAAFPLAWRFGAPLRKKRIIASCVRNIQDMCVPHEFPPQCSNVVLAALLKTTRSAVRRRDEFAENRSSD